jgi:hypothetical protein
VNIIYTRARGKPTRVGDSRGFVIKPAFGLHGFLVNNFKGSILIPVFRLRHKLNIGLIEKKN